MDLTLQPMTREMVRDRIEGYEAAAALDRELLRERPVDPERSFRVLLSLIDVVASEQGWPILENDRRRELSEQTAEKWVRLHRGSVVR